MKVILVLVLSVFALGACATTTGTKTAERRCRRVMAVGSRLPQTVCEDDVNTQSTKSASGAAMVGPRSSPTGSQ